MATVIGAKPSNENTQSFAGKTVNRVYEKTFYVKTSGNEREQAALAAVGVPAIGDYWASGSETDTNARCIDRTATEVSPHFWHVVCEFDSRADDESETPDTAPEARTPEWFWDYETVEVPLVKDAITGNLIQNAAEEPLFMTTEKYIAVLTIRRYETSFARATIFDYGGHLNSAVFWDSAVRTAKMAGIRDSPVEIDGRKLRQVEYVIKFDQDGWEVELLEHGTRYDSNPPAKSWKNFEDAAGNATTGNLIHATGAQNLVAPEYTDPIAPADEIDFNALSLGPW